MRRRLSRFHQCMFAVFGMGALAGGMAGFCTGWSARPVLRPTEAACVATRNGRIYHGLDCHYAGQIPPGSRMWFATTLDAEAGGFRACKRCGGVPSDSTHKCATNGEVK